jgi:hypothetical protein
LHKNNAVNLRTNPHRLAQRSHKIIVVLVLLVLPLFSLAQQSLTNGQQGKIKEILERKNPEKKGNSYGFSPLYVVSQGPSPLNPLENKRAEYFGLSPGFYMQCLGYFCRQEIRLEKITSVPIRFRLGGLDYVNWLEQKPNAAKPR